MKIIRKSEIIELDHSLEEGSHFDTPYRIERSETSEDVIWWGYNTNWKKTGGVWYKLVGGTFIPCDVPEYEIQYLKLAK